MALLRFLKALAVGLAILSVAVPQRSYSLDAFPPTYTKKRIIISTDIGGGDKDDTQSMIHYLAYADMFDLEGVVISRPRGHVREMQRVINAYAHDYYSFRFISADYPRPSHLRRITKIGAERIPYGSGNKTPARGYSHPTEGSRWIVKMARKKDPRPLHIMCWGSTTDVAQAIHDAPDIVGKIFVMAGGGKGYNYIHDPAPTNYLRSLSDLRWIDTEGAGRGIYIGGLHSTRKYGNVGFVEKVIKPRGRLGSLFYEISAPINVNRYGIKMGDTTQLLFIMNGSFKRPFRPSWGGQYCRAPGEKNRFIDCPQDELAYAGYRGAKGVAIHRLDFLKDWERRLKLIYDRDS